MENGFYRKKIKLEVLLKSEHFFAVTSS